MNADQFTVEFVLESSLDSYAPLFMNFNVAKCQQKFPFIPFVGVKNFKLKKDIKKVD